MTSSTLTPAQVAAINSRAQYLAEIYKLSDDRVRELVASDRGPARFCPECQGYAPNVDVIGAWEHEVIRLGTGEAFVAIGCEGYFVVDPSLLGLDKGQWSDFREPEPGLIGYGAVCSRDGQHFVPSDPDDLIHVVDDEGNECGAPCMPGTFGAYYSTPGN